ncbi:hypothetical protein JCM33374_g2728 [Metschnikowia sp. JCM 33374]|nr:hypothetical protein JCM33374_g2728 [Metschnikowia sp. JCM 33374]
MAQEKRKPFKGKKLHKDLRDYKSQEIKRSLVHRARLRKNYFKLLEKEGLPAGHEHTGTDEGATDKPEADAASSDEESGSGSGPDEQYPNEERGEPQLSEADSGSGSGSARKRHGAPLPPQKDIPKTREVVPKRKPLNFAERAKLAKERKEQKREEELRRVQERRRRLEQSQREREQKKLSLSKRTRRGQPVMGPKINDLLDKIRQNS